LFNQNILLSLAVHYFVAPKNVLVEGGKQTTIAKEDIAYKNALTFLGGRIS